MAIFKKQSPLEGNPCRTNGTMIEFSGLYYETEDEADIEFLSSFKCYTRVEAKEEESAEAKEIPIGAKAVTGSISSANLAKLAAANK